MTLHSVQSRLASSMATIAWPVVPIGKNNSGSVSRQSASSRHSSCAVEGISRYPVFVTVAPLGWRVGCALNSEVNFLAHALGGVTNVDAGQVIWQGSIVGNLCISFYTPIAKSDIEWFEMSDGAITHCPCQPSLR
jgi:hypothetical protein